MNKSVFYLFQIALCLLLLGCDKEEEYYKVGIEEINGHECVDLGLSVKWATCNVGADSPGKYGNYYAWGSVGDRFNGVVDVANFSWGDKWRTPTKDDFEELISNCDWTWTTRNSNRGYRVTSKVPGYTDRSIFLPAAGNKNGIVNEYVDTYGYYWSDSETIAKDKAYYMFFKKNQEMYVESSPESIGMSIRPVLPK